ncbi:hypothetical protein GCM10009647_022930 [Streptomyces sanglieri]
MPEPRERPRKTLSPTRPELLPARLRATGGAGGESIGVVEAMVFPVCVGERSGSPGGGAPDGWWRTGPEGCTGPVRRMLLVLLNALRVLLARPGYEREAMVSRTLALISAGIGA